MVTKAHRRFDDTERGALWRHVEIYIYINTRNNNKRGNSSVRWSHQRSLNEISFFPLKLCASYCWPSSSASSEISSSSSSAANFPSWSAQNFICLKKYIWFSKPFDIPCTKKRYLKPQRFDQQVRIRSHIWWSARISFLDGSYPWEWNKEPPV